jgi:hypothetical protein
VVSVAYRLAGYQPRVAEHGMLCRVIDEHLEMFLDAAARTARSSSGALRSNAAAGERQ